MMLLFWAHSINLITNIMHTHVHNKVNWLIQAKKGTKLGGIFSPKEERDLSSINYLSNHARKSGRESVFKKVFMCPPALADSSIYCEEACTHQRTAKESKL